MTTRRNPTPSSAQVESAPVTSVEDIAAWLRSGCTERAAWRIGTEYETFGFERATKRPLPYEGKASVRAWLCAMQAFGWRPLSEEGRVIALERRGASISLEPGGQLELSGRAVANLHETKAELRAHMRQALQAAEGVGVGLLGLGFLPLWGRADTPWMPKQRYAIMRRYMPQRGRLGLDMMQRSCATQVNLDFSDEERMTRQFRLALSLQPVVGALFANSPLCEGKANGFLSYRSHVWSDTDPERCGDLPFVFAPDFGFRRYAEFVLDVPMYFVRRGGRYIDVAGSSLRDFLRGRLKALPGVYPVLDDVRDHMSTIFTDVRLKRYLEVRGADGGGPVTRLCALPAFWTGLMYDDASLDDAWRVVRDWDAETRARLRFESPRLGLRARAGQANVGEIALDMLALARSGLKRRAFLDEDGRDESHFLDPLEEQARKGVTPAEEILALWRGGWGETPAALMIRYVIVGRELEMKGGRLEIADCPDMATVRRCIDVLDGRMMALLLERARYVRRAAQLKTRGKIIDPERIAEIIASVRVQAEAGGLDPDMAEAVWREMIAWFIRLEEAMFDAGRAG